LLFKWITSFKLELVLVSGRKLLDRDVGPCNSNLVSFVLAVFRVDSSSIVTIYDELDNKVYVRVLLLV